MNNNDSCYVESSSGSIEFDFATGAISENESEYRLACKVDINEYQDWRNSNQLPLLRAGQSVDCLLIGWWQFDGEYIAADAQGRKDFLEEKSYWYNTVNAGALTEGHK